MYNININSLASFALRNGVSFIGGRSSVNVLSGTLGELVFMFSPQYAGNIFFQWVYQNFNSKLYSEKYLVWHGKIYHSIFLKIPQNIDKKFLLSFRYFVEYSTHLVNYF